VLQEHNEQLQLAEGLRTHFTDELFMNKALVDSKAKSFRWWRMKHIASGIKQRNQ